MEDRRGLIADTTCAGSSALWRAVARFVIVAACACALWRLGQAVVGQEIEWRMLALAALALAAGPIRLETRSARGGAAEFPAVHGVLFGCALALGPAAAAIPGVFTGIARLLASSQHRKPIHLFAFTLLKPAAICSISAAAYAYSGGDPAVPQAVSSVLPALAAAAAFAAAAVVLQGATEALGEGARHERPRPTGVAVGWFSCLAAGYALAVVYAVAPSYVLVAPIGAALLAWLARPKMAPQAEEADAEPEVQNRDADPSNDEFAFVDPATGLATRRYLEMFLESEVGRVGRFRKSVSLAVFDLDEFRAVHASGGREQLDAALREIGAALKAGLRDYDIVARYSAGRLAVALPESTAQHAFDVAERLHASLESIRVSDRPVSVSVGVASCPEHASTAEELINSAHHALNRGRFGGPNRVYACEQLDKVG